MTVVDRCFPPFAAPSAPFFHPRGRVSGDGEEAAERVPDDVAVVVSSVSARASSAGLAPLAGTVDAVSAHLATVAQVSRLLGRVVRTTGKAQFIGMIGVSALFPA